MRFPYLQVERRSKRQAQLVALRLGISRHAARGLVQELWEAGLDIEEGAPIRTHLATAEEVAAAVEWDGEHGALCDALVAGGFLERDASGFRIRGMSRYVAKLNQWKAAGQASGKARQKQTGVERQSNGRSTGVERSANGIEQTETETEKQEEISAQSQPVLLEVERSGPRREKTAREKGRTGSRRPASEKPASGPRASDALVEDFRQATGGKYVWQGAKDGAALAYLLKHAPLEEVRRRWRAGLLQCGWLHTATVAQLRAKWNDLGAAPPAPLSQDEIDRQRREEVFRMLAEQEAESKRPLASEAGVP